MNKWSLKRLSGPLSILAICLLFPAAAWSEYEYESDAESCGVGDRVDCLIRRAGPPQSVITVGDRSYYTWRVSWRETRPTYRSSFLPGTAMYYGGDVIEHWCQSTVEVGEDRRIIAQTYQGPDCPQ